MRKYLATPFVSTGCVRVEKERVGMSSCKVAVVTGSNKGIGLAIVRSLCKQYDGTVYLTAR